MISGALMSYMGEIETSFERQPQPRMNSGRTRPPNIGKWAKMEVFRVIPHLARALEVKFINIFFLNPFNPNYLDVLTCTRTC